ncbi:MAG: RnfH family protein [Pseudomonadota bacterium]
MRNDGTDESIAIEVACALPTHQRIVSLSVAAGCTVIQAVEASGIAADFPELDMSTVTFGIFERPVEAETILADGDRVTLLRPLVIDPKEQRRLRARRQGSSKS